MASQTAPQKPIHRPVMLGKVLLECEALFKNHGVYVDCTMGDGGHSHAIFKEFVEDNDNQTLLSLDWDKESYKFVSTFFKEKPSELKLDSNSNPSKNNWYYCRVSFAKVGIALDKLKRTAKLKTPFAKMILFDLGISSRQIAQKDRGFSFTGKGKIDMRMDPETYAIAAYDLLNSLSVAKLTTMFIATVGIKKQTARMLAQEIIAARSRKPFGNSDDVTRINGITSRIVPIRKGAIGRLHPSTLVFLALRIAVNTELFNLYEVLPVAKNFLAEGGKILVMTYHSSEEKIVDKFVKMAHMTVKKYLPSKNEIAGNPRARSAKLFVLS